MANFTPSFFLLRGWRWIPKNLTVDLDLCCCRARIRVACWLRKPPAEPDIWGAWRDEAYNEKRMLFITLLAPWPKHNGCKFNMDLVESIKKMGCWFKPFKLSTSMKGREGMGCIIQRECCSSPYSLPGWSTIDVKSIIIWVKISKAWGCRFKSFRKIS